jgi:hypothetical protein
VLNPHNQITFIAGESLVGWQRVKISQTIIDRKTPTVVAAQADDETGIGVIIETPCLTEANHYVVGDAITVSLIGNGGKQQGIASVAITRGDPLFAANDGKISNVGTVPLRAVAYNSAAIGDVFEFVYN